LNLGTLPSKHFSQITAIGEFVEKMYLCRMQPDKHTLAKNWIHRYTGLPAEAYGDWILLTNFDTYIQKFAERFNVSIHGEGRPMQAAVNRDGLSIINFGMGSANAATVMDLLRSLIHI